jgi:ABC-type multidrug transport system fused ATPase/permease subunit
MSTDRPPTAAEATTETPERPSGVQGRLRGTWQLFQPFLGVSPKRIGILAFCAVTAGVCEGAILALLVQVGVVLSGGIEHLDVPLPFVGTVSLRVPGILAVAFVLSVIRLGIQYVEAYLPAKMSSDVEVSLRTTAFNAFVDAEWDAQSKEREGQLPTVLNNEVTLAATAMQQVSLFISAFLSFLALIIMSVAINAVAAATIVVVCTVLFFALRPLSRLTRSLSGQRLEAFRMFSVFVTESVRMAEESQVFGAAPELKRRADDVTRKVEAPHFQTRFYAQLMPSLYRNIALILVIVGLSAVYAVGGNALSSVGAVVLILIRSLTYSQTCQAVLHRLHEVAPYMERVTQIVEDYQARERVTGDEVLGPIRSLSFSHVSYGYDPVRPVVIDLSFESCPGEVVGVVGRSGAGKSTFVQLLLRLRDPQQGQVLVNGRDAIDYDLPSWQSRFAYVPQESQVVEDTVANNIRFYRPDVSDEAVVAAAKRAHLHDDIVTMPLGYETPISQRADALSGGQRQRLSLARALVRDPQVLVLDEPTSALDVKSEALVLETLRELRGHVTLFIVAHRMSTLELCDRIMVLSEGRLKSFGAPDEVKATDSFYREALTLSGLS